MMLIRRMLAVWLLLTGAAAAQQPAALRVVVIEGEDAVNIIQQKTAVRPIVEVRDRNNLPVAGALVTFSIEGGTAASFGGLSTLTVATNAAGQAAVTSLTPATAGAFQIQVSAAFQGQIATATIAQTNVLTAAQAAAAGAATGGGSAGSAGSGSGGAGGGAGGSASGGASGGAGAGGAAGGAGGGLSATTIGIAGAAVAGGAIAAGQLAGGEDGKDDVTGSFSGAFSGTIVSTVTSRNVPANSCTITRAVSGRAQITLDTNTASSVSGRIEVSGTDTVVSQTCVGPNGGASFTEQAAISGTPSALRAEQTVNETRSGQGGEIITSVRTFAFDGSLSGNVITGTIKHEQRSASTGAGGGPVDELSQGTFPVTLSKS